MKKKLLKNQVLKKRSVKFYTLIPFLACQCLDAKKSGFSDKSTPVEQ